MDLRDRKHTSYSSWKEGTQWKLIAASRKHNASPLLHRNADILTFCVKLDGRYRGTPTRLYKYTLTTTPFGWCPNSSRTWLYIGELGNPNHETGDQYARWQDRGGVGYRPWDTHGVHWIQSSLCSGTVGWSKSLENLHDNLNQSTTCPRSSPPM